MEKRLLLSSTWRRLENHSTAQHSIELYEANFDTQDFDWKLLGQALWIMDLDIQHQVRRLTEMVDAYNNGNPDRETGRLSQWHRAALEFLQPDMKHGRSTVAFDKISNMCPNVPP